MIVVNLFGAPNAGKTGVAAGLFGKLKKHSFEVDYVPEPVRMAHYAKNEALLNDELMLFSMKNHSIQAMINGGIQVAIMDGPLLNSLVYCQADYYQHFSGLVKEVHDSYTNINLFFPGVRAHYSTIGRGEASAEEASSRGDAVKIMLEATGQLFHTIEPGDDLDMSDVAFTEVVQPRLHQLLNIASKKKINP